MSSSELEAFLTEMEPDIRAAEREMREIELLEKKGATAPGRLLGTFHGSTVQYPCSIWMFWTCQIVRN